MMKRIVWWIGLMMVGVLGLTAPVGALLSQPIDPEAIWLTVYQGADRGWVVERMSLALTEGDNHFMLAGGDLLRSRFFLKALAEEVVLHSLSTAENGFRISLNASAQGRYPVMISYFESGFDWREWYSGRLDQAEMILWLSPTVSLSNANPRQWLDVNVSWLMGSPAFEIERDFDLFEAEELMVMPMMEAAPSVAPDMKRAAPPVLEQVSDYQVFRLPYQVDFPARARLAVFPGERQLPYTELYRYQNGTTQRILTLLNEGDPLAGGVVRLFTGDTEPLGRFVFPLVRSQEEFEVSLGTSRLVTADRTVVRYRRLSVEWNDDREVTGFVSEREVSFQIENRLDRTVTVELVEPLPRDGKITKGRDWQWEDGKAIRTLTVGPHQELFESLEYEFREVL